MTQDALLHRIYGKKPKLGEPPHAFTVRDVIKGSPVIRCANNGCKVVWWCDRNRPQSACKHA